MVGYCTLKPITYIVLLRLTNGINKHMPAKIRSFLCYFSVLLINFQFNIATAQSLQLDTSSQEEYQFNVKKTEEYGFLTSFYEAVSRDDQSKPFEIIITETAKQLMNIDGVCENLKKTLNNLDSGNNLKLLKENRNNNEKRQLYKVTSKSSTLLFLMREYKDSFTMIEAEFPNEELQKVSIEKWQTIFWHAKN